MQDLESEASSRPLAQKHSPPVNDARQAKEQLRLGQSWAAVKAQKMEQIQDYTKTKALKKIKLHCKDNAQYAYKGNTHTHTRIHKRTHFYIYF